MMGLQILASALCYFLFHWQFLRCVESIAGAAPARGRSMTWTFGLNYTAFFLCTMLELHLIANWLIFLVLLFGEQLLLYKQSPSKSFLFALLGTQFGMAANILFRSLMAILLNVPLIAFDSQISMPGNRKAYPVLLGFLAAGLVFRLITRYGWLKRLALVLEDRRTLAFLMGLFVFMHFYLYMNFLVYYVQANDLILKLWSMKSAGFVIVGECLTVILSIRMGELAAYRAKSLESRAQLTQERARELELRAIAVTDPLTRCENRLQADKCLQTMLDEKRAFCLCFADLNGLKSVNDGFGHAMGDGYLLAAAHVLGQVCRPGDRLFRYGGDEFLLLFFDLSAEQAASRMAQVQPQLEEERRRREYPFPMAVSYGIATPADGANANALIQAADERMYRMKQVDRL